MFLLSFEITLTFSFFYFFTVMKE